MIGVSLRSAVVETFFAPCWRAIKAELREQLVGLNAKYILVVGGFGESKYLRTQIDQAFGNRSCQVVLLDDGT
jgi:tRNA A37 threonylcarbamoyltransferase TsaD